MFLENLEDRRLLTVGPQLIGIQPNEGALIPLNSDKPQVYDVAPNHVVFNFDENQVFDADNLDGIQITRANLDGEFQAAFAETNFGLGGDALMRFTAAKLGIEGNDISLVFSQRNQGGFGLPEINIEGSQINVVLNISTNFHSTAEQVVAALTQDRDAYALVRVELTDDQYAQVDVTEGETIDYSPVHLSGANDLVVNTGFVGLGDTPNQLIVRYADTLPDDLYRIDVFGDGNNALRNASGAALNDIIDDGVDQGSDVSALFELDLGAQIISVIPQPIVSNLEDGEIVRTQRKDQILLFFNEDDLHQDSVINPQFYRLSRTFDTVEFADDLNLDGDPDDPYIFFPTQIQYNPVTNGVLLTFEDDFDKLPGQGAFRLKVGSSEALPSAPVVDEYDEGIGDTGNEFASALPIDSDDLLSGGVIIDGQITETEDFPIVLPGSSDEPGHREFNIETENHISLGESDDDLNISIVKYCFQNNLGQVPGDNGLQPAYNTITEVQKQRAREILEQLQGKIGVQFVETEDQGVIIATGDLAVMGDGEVSAIGGTLGLAGTAEIDGVTRQVAMMDDAENWNNEFGESWYQTAMHEIGHVLGLQHAYDLPAHTVMGQGTVEESEYGPALLENDHPGQHDLVHLNHLHPRESRDIDLYKFQVDTPGVFVAETFAERLRDNNNSNRSLNSAIRLLQNTEDGMVVVAQNDDYYSDDSYLEVPLSKGEYFLGVSSSGNISYDPNVVDSGFYGTSEGVYQLKMFFRPDIDLGDPAESVADLSVLVDADNPIDVTEPGRIRTAFDGDADGRPGGDFNFWFVAAAEETDENEAVEEPRIYFVDKMSSTDGSGRLNDPFNNLQSAVGVLREGDVLRLLANTGWDNDITTELDNFAYELGFNSNGGQLSDGSRFEVPKGVVLQVDSGVIFKMRRSYIGIGSTSAADILDKSGSAIQVLGAPSIVDDLGNVLPGDGTAYDAVDADGEFMVRPLESEDSNVLDGKVHFTSYGDETIGLDTFPLSTTPSSGDWGGILIHNGIDGKDESRFGYEVNGIFLNHINNAEIMYGGGQVLIESKPQVINPIEIVDARPTISQNIISFSSDAAISASPNSFEESNFHSPQYQEEFSSRPFTSDYKRVGPDIYGNDVLENTTNGLSVRITTLSGDQLQKLETFGRFDDFGITHVIQENLVIASTPGGPFEETKRTNLSLIILNPSNVPDGEFPIAPGETSSFRYKLVFVDRYGNESLATEASHVVTLNESDNAVQLDQITPGYGDFISRRLYRSSALTTAQLDDPSLEVDYQLVAILNQEDPSFLDTGVILGGELDQSDVKLRPRLDSRLVIDPSVVVKLDGAYIHAEVGANLIIEGNSSNEVVLTSILDDRYGAGNFDTSNDGAPDLGAGNVPLPGGWGGIFMAPESVLSVDHARISYAGGVVSLEGSFAAINAVELRQAEGRVANSLFEFNAGGFGGQAPDSRYGRGVNEESVIFASDSQPIIVSNTFRDNFDADLTSRIAAISINANSLDHVLKSDYGASVGSNDSLSGFLDNRGPLVVDNRIAGNEINGMVIRGEVLTTQSVWDDTDIAHVMFDEVVVPDFHSYGGLRLQSSADQSLVVKLEGDAAGFKVTGRPLEIDDRIGGALQIIGQPKSPVVLTSLRDDSVGAGITPAGDPLTDTNNDGIFSTNAFLDVQTAQINLNFGPQMQANAAAMSTVRAAADAWERVLADPVVVELDVEFADLGGPAGEMSSVLYPLAYDNLRDALILDAKPDDETIVYDLPTFDQLSVQGADFADTVQITTANAKALGFTSGFPNVVSAFGGGVIDGTMSIASTSNNANADFLSVALHEVGHALGFVSGVGEVDEGSAVVDLTSMDLFRVAPGQGAQGLFTSTPRVVDPTLDHVFYDGGRFDPSAITTIPGLGLGDIPLATGENNGDGWQPSHLKQRNDINGVFLGIMDPVENPAFDSPLDNDKRILDLIGWDVIYAGPPTPGDWNTILLDEFSHDRNLVTVVEAEARNVNVPGPNASTTQAQYIGQLAPHQKAGDDIRSLGFEVNGLITSSKDVDVFSFEAESGTRVYIDIDRSTHALDAVIELVDGSGQVLVRSVNSLEETQSNQLPFVADAMENKATTLIRNDQLIGGKDFWGINPRDPGMHIELPGPEDTRNLYHIRVRSNSDNLEALDGGLSAGAYVMQIRLQELDEIPGSRIQYSNIGYASTGITVQGQPVHSWLAGETKEIEDAIGQNDTLAGAQFVGNVMESERGVISIAGMLHEESPGTPGWDVDWYSFKVDPQELSPDATDALGEGWSWPLVVDVDYADGLGRPNTRISIFNSSGALIYSGSDSNITDDRPLPLAERETADLSRGSVGASDPFLGPISFPPTLEPDEFYFLAISHEEHVPTILANGTASLEPISATRRIAEDWIEPKRFLLDPAYKTNRDFLDPLNQTPRLWDIDDTLVATVIPHMAGPADGFGAEVPYALSDIPLVISTGFGLQMVNSFSGEEYFEQIPPSTVPFELENLISVGGDFTSVTVSGDPQAPIPTERDTPICPRDVYGNIYHTASLNGDVPTGEEYEEDDDGNNDWVGIQTYVVGDRPNATVNVKPAGCDDVGGRFIGARLNFHAADAETPAGARPDANFDFPKPTVVMAMGDRSDYAEFENPGLIDNGADGADWKNLVYSFRVTSHTDDKVDAFPDSDAEDRDLDEDNVHSFNHITPLFTDPINAQDPRHRRAWTNAWHQGSIVFGSQIVAQKPTEETHIAGMEVPDDPTETPVDRYAGFNPYTDPPLVNWPALTASDWAIEDGDFLQVAFQDSIFDFEFDFGPQVKQEILPLQGRSVRDGFFFVLDPSENNEGDEHVFQFDTGVVIEFFDTITDPATGAFDPAGNFLPDGTVIQIGAIDDDENPLSFTFEFDLDDNQLDPTATRIEYNIGTPANQLASRLAEEINDINNIKTTASAIAGRVSLNNDLRDVNAHTITNALNPAGINDAVRKLGAGEAAAMLHVKDNSNLLSPWGWEGLLGDEAERTNHYRTVNPWVQDGDFIALGQRDWSISGSPGVVFIFQDEALDQTIESVATRANTAFPGVDQVLIPYNSQNFNSEDLIDKISDIVQTQFDEFGIATQIGGPRLSFVGELALFVDADFAQEDAARAWLPAASELIHEYQNPENLDYTQSVEETFTADQIGWAVETAFGRLTNTEWPYTADAHGDRINFLNAASGDFRGMNTESAPGVRWIDQGTFGGAQGAGFPIQLNASMTAAEVAQTIEAELAVVLNPLGVGVSLVPPDRVEVDGALVDSTLVTQGEGPGGNPTGMALISAANAQFVAVTDNGGIYFVDAANGPILPEQDPFIPANYVGSPDYVGISFTDITKGPNLGVDPTFGIEGDQERVVFTDTNGNEHSPRYEDIFFASDDQGVVYAFMFDIPEFPQFSNSVIPVPVFVNGSTSIDTGAIGATGLAFGNYTSNPWKVRTSFDDLHIAATAGASEDEDVYACDPNRGIFPTTDGSRLPAQYTHDGNIYHTFEDENGNPYGPAIGSNYHDGTGARNHCNYWFVEDSGSGGSSRTEDDRTINGGRNIMSNEETEYRQKDTRIGRRDDWGLEFDLDSARANAGVHGSIISNEFSLEGYSFADNPSLYFQYLYDNGGEPNIRHQHFGIPRIYITDNSGAWQEITRDDGRLLPTGTEFQSKKIDLSSYAGVNHLRLRIDYDTRNNSFTGDPLTTGAELRAIDGSYIEDGELLLMNGRVTLSTDVQFEFPGQDPVDAFLFEQNHPVLNDLFSFVEPVDSLAPARIAIDLEYLQESRVPLTLLARLALDAHLEDNPDDTVILLDIDNDDVILTGDFFEFEIGSTFNAPTGAAIPHDSEFELDGTLFAFVKPNLTPTTTVPSGQRIEITDQSTPAEVAEAMNDVMNDVLPNDLLFIDGEKVVSPLTDFIHHPINGMDLERFISGKVGLNYQETFGSSLYASEINVTDGLGYLNRNEVAEQTQIKISEQVFVSEYVLSPGNSYVDGGHFSIENNSAFYDDLHTHEVFEFDNGAVLQIDKESLANGDTFVIENLATTDRLEVYFDNLADSVEPPNGWPGPVVEYSGGMSNRSIAARLIEVIENSGLSTILDLQLRNSGNGQVSIHSSIESLTFSWVNTDSPLDPVVHPNAEGTPGVGTNLEVIANDTVVDIDALNGTEIRVEEADGTVNSMILSTVGLNTAAEVAVQIADWLNDPVQGYSLQHSTDDSHVSIDNNNGIVVSVIPAAVPGSAGIVVEPHHRVFNVRSAAHLGSDVAEQVRNAVEAGIAGVDVTIAAPANRLQIVTDTGVNVEIEHDTAGIDKQGAPDSMIPLHNDLLRIIGSTVSSPGPLGLHAHLLENGRLAGDTLLWNTAWSREPGLIRLDPDRHQGDSPNPHQGADGPYVKPDPFPATTEPRRPAFILDNFVIGFSERGETVTNSISLVPGTTNFIVDNSFTTPPQEATESGAYQIEIRPSNSYHTITDEGEFVFTDIYDTNDRLEPNIQITMPSGENIAHGQTFTITDGLTDVTFEFVDEESGLSHSQGNYPILFDSSSDESGLAIQLRQALNQPEIGRVIDVQAVLSDGADGNRYPDIMDTDSREDFRFLDGDSTVCALACGVGSSNVVYLLGDDIFVKDFGNLGVEFHEFPEIEDGVFDESQKLKGDSNAYREQGQLVLHGNHITNAQDFGIVIEAGERVGRDGFAPHSGSVRNMDELNLEQLIPGVTVTNNLVARNLSGGIRFSGDPNVIGPDAPVPFGRIINNTIIGVGGALIDGMEGQDTGILVTDFASPTLINNIVANTSQGISIDQTSNTTVVAGSLYQGNLINTNYGGEDFALAVSTVDPLFVDPRLGVDNYYLDPGTSSNPNLAIDSSIGSLGERYTFNLVKEPLDIAPSPIIAPETDITGQLRVDDPSVEPSFGIGTNVFIDRGAIDRADFAGPTALLIGPRDNDVDGVDRDQADYSVKLNKDQVVSSFEIRLDDGFEPTDPDNGIGVADHTVVSEKVVLRSNSRLLKDGVDYSFGYNAVNNTIRLTPLAGIWPVDQIYTIELVNQDHWRLAADRGFDVSDGTIFSIVSNDGVQADFEFDRGYSLQVPQTFKLQFPEEGGGLGGILDGDTIEIRNGTTAVIFEFDRDDDWIASRERVEFETTDTPDQLAGKLKSAIDLKFPELNLFPKIIGGGSGELHLGANIAHQINIASATLNVIGGNAAIVDGQTFEIDNGEQVLKFEFEDTHSSVNDGLTDPENIPIKFTMADTHEDLAVKIQDTINASDLDFVVAAIAEGTVHIGGSLNIQVEATSNSALIQRGTPGTRTELGLKIHTHAGQIHELLDGDTFRITSPAGVTKVFEFNNQDEDLDDEVVLGNLRIDFDNSTSVDQLMESIIIAITGSGLDLNPVLIDDGRPIVLFGADTNYSAIAVSNGVSISGVAGLPASVPVAIKPLPNFDGIQVAASIVRAIQEQTQIDVSAKPQGANELILYGAQFVSDNQNLFITDEWNLETPRSIAAIEDWASNSLKPNQLSGETLFVIDYGHTEADYGDASDGNSVSGLLPLQQNYQTLLGNNPPIHVYSGLSMSLGERRDVDVNGQPEVEDDNDGSLYSVDTSGAVGLLGATQSSSMTVTVQNLDTLTVTAQGDQFLGGEVLVVAEKGFQFDTSGLLTTGDLVGDNLIIAISVTDQAQPFTTSEIADEITLAIAGSGLTTVNASVVNGNEVHITSTDGVTVNADAVGGLIEASVQRAHVTDGDTFEIIDPDRIDPDSNPPVPLPYIFELDSTAALGNSALNWGIEFNPEDVANVVADKIVSYLTSHEDLRKLNLNPIHRGNGLIEFTGDDEDGVFGSSEKDPIGFFNPYVVTQLYVESYTENSHLDAWVDFNLDGDWSDPHEQIARSLQLSEGLNVINVETPLVYENLSGKTFARFRVSPQGGLTPGGLVYGGEVEDYLVEIVKGRPPIAIDDPDGQLDGFSTDENTSLPVSGSSVDPSILDNDSDSDQNDIRVISYSQFSSMGASVTVDQNWKSAGATSGTFTYDPSSEIDVLSVSVDGNGVVDDDILIIGNTTFQLETSGVDPLNGNVFVNIDSSDSESDIADKLANAINGELINGVKAIASETEIHVLSVGGVIVDANSATGIEVSQRPNYIQALHQGEVVTDTFTYRLEEDTSSEDAFGFESQTSATVTITLTGLNDEPVSQDIPLAAMEDGVAITAGFVGDDVDNDDDVDTLTYTIVTNLDAGEGTVVNNDDGTFTFDPGADFQELAEGQTLDVSFTYKATDQHGADSNTATVTITVTGVNDDPTAIADAITVDQDVVTTQAAAGVLTNDIEPDTSDSKMVTKLNGTDLDSGTNSLTVTSSKGATFTINEDGAFSYDPTASTELKALDPGDTAEDQFTYTMSDPHGQTSQTTITFTVNGVNDTPVATDDAYATGQTQTLTVDPAGVLGNDSDADADDTITVTQINSSGSLIGTSVEGATITMNSDGSFVYDPTSSATLPLIARGDSLNDTFTYTIEDSQGTTASAIVTVTVSGENKAPVAVDDDFLANNGITEDETLTDAIGVLDNDTDADDLATALFVSGLNGTNQLSAQSTNGALVTMNADGTFLYDPRGADPLQALADGVVATDTFTYTVSDGQGGSDEGTVTIEVTGVNDAPVANPDSVLGPRNADLIIDVIKAADDTDPGHDYDVDGTIDVVTITEQPDASAGQVVVNGDKTVTFQPAADFSGTTTFTYQLTDDFGATSNEVTVSVEINDGPFADDDSTDAYQDVFNTPTRIDVLANDSDADGSLVPSTVTVVTAPQHGQVTVDADGTILYQPDVTPDVYVGADSLQYTVADDDGAVSNVATVSINVIPDPFPWHNRSNGMDVNNDGFISPLDALLVISELNSSGSYTLPEPSTGFSPPPFLDVNENGTIEPADALEVINYLNDNANGEGEGEFVAPATMDIAEVAQQAISAMDAPANNGFAADNLQTTGLSQIRSEVLEDLLSDIADEVSDSNEEDTDENALDNFFGQF
ncbi:MAG: tandem-95 repeat protein [SAR202 cluster bacterium]|nr:tandem-95 repeat protein [SAR202 cluster bacterium]